MPNRRHLPRWEISRQAKVKLEGTEEFVECVISDINSRGMKLALSMKLPEDKIFHLSVCLDDGVGFEAEAWMAWQRAVEGTNIYGIYFNKVKDSDRDKIYQFVRKDSPQQINQRWWSHAGRDSDEGGEVMEETNFEDRRIFERFSVKLPLKFFGVNSGAEGNAQTCDISAKGIGFVTDKPLPLRSALEIWLHIPDKGQPLYARGEVVWSKPEGDLGHRLGINLEKADLMGMSRVLRAM